MTNQARIDAIYRYPVKGLSPQRLQQVALSAGETVPADRLYAIENGPSGFDPARPGLSRRPLIHHADGDLAFDAFRRRSQQRAKILLDPRHQLLS